MHRRRNSQLPNASNYCKPDLINTYRHELFRGRLDLGRELIIVSPLRPDSDQIPQHSEMTRCAIRGNERSYQLVGGRRRRWWGSRKPSHPQQALQDLCTASKAIRLRLIGSVAPSVARVRIFSARHAITEDVRSASGTVWAASFRTPLNKAQRSVGGEFSFPKAMALLQKSTTNENEKDRWAKGAATLTKTITTSSKTGRPDPLNAFHSFGKLR